MNNRCALALLLCGIAILGAGFPCPVAARPPAPSLAPSSPIPAGTRQLLVAVADSWEHTSGVLTLYERTAPSAPWEAVARPIPVRFGRAGMAWGRGLEGRTPGPGLDPGSGPALNSGPGPDSGPPSSGLNAGSAPGTGPVKREGDGKAPAGVFTLGPAFAYEPKELGLVKMDVLRADAELICVDDPASQWYNTLVNPRAVGVSGKTGGPSHEDMRRPDEQYRFGLVVGHNQNPAVPGAGSCVFLHVWRSPESPTAGCTAMAPQALKALITRLDPARRPLLVQLPRDEYTRLRRMWDLP